jgi:hypothetical protein
MELANGLFSCEMAPPPVAPQTLFDDASPRLCEERAAKMRRVHLWLEFIPRDFVHNRVK